MAEIDEISALSSETEKLEKGELLKSFEQSVRMSVSHPDALSVSGTAGLERVEDLGGAVASDKDDFGELLLLLDAQAEFLERLKAQIAETRERIRLLEEQRREAVGLYEAAFERMDEAEYLLSEISDGISDEERLRLASLLGPEALGANEGTLQRMLFAQIAADQKLGISASERIAQIEASLVEERRLLEELEAMRKQYERARSHEERAHIEQNAEILEEYHYKSKPETHSDKFVNFDTPTNLSF